MPRCPPPRRASRSCCPPTTKRRGSDRRSTSCSATSIGRARLARVVARRTSSVRGRSWSWTTAATTTRPRSSTARPEAESGPTRRRSAATAPRSLLRAPRRQGRGGPRGDPRLDRPTSWSSPTPTWPRRPTSCRCSPQPLRDADVALGSRVQPDGTDRRSSQPLHRRLLGRFFHLLAGCLGDRSRARHAVRLQGISHAGRPRPLRAPEDHQHRVRRRGHPPRASARLSHRDRAGAVVRRARIAHARPARGWRCASHGIWYEFRWCIVGSGRG